MYIVKEEFEGNDLSLPLALRAEFGAYLILSNKTKQNILKALFEAGHPAIVKKEKDDKSK